MHYLTKETLFAVPYFISFVLLTNWLMYNLFVAVILDHFAHLSPSSSTPSLHTLIDRFRHTWTEVNPSDPYFIDMPLLEKFVLSLPPPLGNYR